MKEHIILEKAKKYEVPDDKNKKPSGYTYKDSEGFWKNEKTNAPMIKEDKSKTASTKKCDVETGEDQKGE